jgi:hypothetical protein
LKADVNTDGRTDDKMDTGNSGIGKHAIDNCLLLYALGAGSEMSEDADGGCAAGDVDVSTLKTGFVSSGEHIPVSQNSHNVCRSLTVLVRRRGQRRHPGRMDAGQPVSRPGGCPGGTEMAGCRLAFAARW